MTLPGNCWTRSATRLNAEYEFLGYDDTVPWPAVPGAKDDLAKDRDLLDHVCRPLAEKQRVKLLTRLWVLTKRRPSDAAEMKLTIGTYVEELAAFPGEAVERAILEWPRRADENAKWWPALAEIIRTMNPTAVRLAALRKALWQVTVP